MLNRSPAKVPDGSRGALIVSHPDHAFKTVLAAWVQPAQTIARSLTRRPRSTLDFEPPKNTQVWAAWYYFGTLSARNHAPADPFGLDCTTPRTG